MLPKPREAKATMKGQSAFTSKERRERPEGITAKRAYQVRAISNHPDIVERVKAQATMKGTIRTHVLGHPGKLFKPRNGVNYGK